MYCMYEMSDANKIAEAYLKTVSKYGRFFWSSFIKLKYLKTNDIQIKGGDYRIGHILHSSLVLTVIPYSSQTADDPCLV